MLMVLHEFFAANTEVVATIPNLKALVGSLDLLCKEIQTASQHQFLYSHGAGVNKRLVKANMMRLMADISRKLSAFAMLTNDPVLQQEVRTTNFALTHMTDNSLGSFCRILLDRGNLSLDLTAAYGLIHQNLKDLEAALQSYEQALSEPRLARAGRKMATGQLAILFCQIDVLLKKSDILVEIVREREHNFYQGYRNSRKLINRVGHGLQLIITVVDKVDGQPLPRVLCQLASKEQPSHMLLSKKSAAKGSFKVKSLEGGPFLLTVTRPGYQEMCREIFVTKGKFMRVMVELGRSEE
jgi:hypothetical protein